MDGFFDFNENGETDMLDIFVTHELMEEDNDDTNMDEDDEDGDEDQEEYSDDDEFNDQD
jgi:hypothetical protein